MPRQAAASIGFATGTAGTRTQIMPPDDLNPLEKTEFIDVVLGSPANHFLPADIAMISLYVRHTVGERIAFGEFQAAPIVDGKPSPWLAIMVAHSRVMTTTARRLNINPANRVSKAEHDETPGVLTRLTMEARRHERNGN